MLLAEELLLLALDDERGTGGPTSSFDGALAGAVLLDPVLAGRLRERDGALVPAGAGALEPPLLDQALRVVRAEERPRDARHWLGALEKALKPLRVRVAEGLVERGVLGEERGKVLGLFPRTRYPERDGAPEREPRERLRGILLAGAEPDERSAALLGLLGPLGMVRGLVPREERKRAEARAKEAARRGSVDAALSDAIQAAQTAVLTATIAASAAATAGSATGT